MIVRMKTKQKQQTIKLRIIGGQMRGRTIRYHGADFTRPMKDNIRENLFNIIGQSIRGTKCFDLFAGTGALALEALSRGAAAAVLVEQHRLAAKCIQQTVASLDLESKAQVLTGDAFRLAGPLFAPPLEDTPWCVFLCPPYKLWTTSLNDLNRIIVQVIQHAPPGSVLVSETEKSFDPDNLPSGDWDLRVYGGTRLAFIRPAMVCGMSL
jgi:16S rRNA (guanine966-N2)-methyltransferase